MSLNYGKAGLALLGVLLGLAVISVPFWFKTVPAGERGVHLQWGDTVTDEEFQPGPHYVMPIRDGVYNMNVRYQSMTISDLSIKTEDGLNLKGQATLRYRVRPDQAVEVYDNYGRDYQKTLALEQEFRDALKNTADSYNEEIYKGKRTQYTNDVEASLRSDLNGTGIEVDAVQIENINLPPSVEEAIENKVSKKHEIQAAERQVEVERQQARAKKVEARGIRKAQEIIQESLAGPSGKRYIDYYWIKEGLSKGDNVYIVGDPASQPGTSGGSGLPLYKDVDSELNDTELNN